MFSSSNFYAPDIGVLSAYSGETKTSTTTAVSSSPSNFYTNRIVLCNEANVLKDLFAKSVEAMIDGIERNKYNHHKGSVISRPVCLCERCQSWKFDLCAECGKDLGPIRLAEEERQAQLVKDEDKKNQKNHAEHLHSLGIRVDILINFTSAHGCWDWPTWRVVRDIISPSTKETRCRYGDLPELKQGFGPPTVFMSHCWAGLWKDLVVAAASGARKDRYVWIDIFAVRQWPGNDADLDFRSVIKRSKAIMVVVPALKHVAKDIVTKDTMTMKEKEQEILKQMRGMIDQRKRLVRGPTMVSEPARLIHKPKHQPRCGDICGDICGMIFSCCCFGKKDNVLEDHVGSQSPLLEPSRLLTSTLSTRIPNNGPSTFYSNYTSISKPSSTVVDFCKTVPYFRLWCIVEIAAAYENDIEILVKIGNSTKEAITNGEIVISWEPEPNFSAYRTHLKDNVDIFYSECAVQDDYVREMNRIHEITGSSIYKGVLQNAVWGKQQNVIEGMVAGNGVESVNAIVSETILECTGVYTISAGSINILNAALCGEEEPLRTQLRVNQSYWMNAINTSTRKKLHIIAQDVLGNRAIKESQYKYMD